MRRLVSFTSFFFTSFVVEFQEVGVGLHQRGQIVKQPVIHSEPLQVADRLRLLGVEEEHLKTAVAAGFAAWASCTPHHPPAAPGLSAWFETVAVLRDQLAPEGFESFNDQNLPLTIHPETRVAIAVSSGDEATGRREANPSTKSDKGPRTIHAVAVNRDQLSLFDDDALPMPDIAEEKHETWVLLVYRDELARVVRSELSRPIGLASDNRVNDWAERIILDALPFDGDADLFPVDTTPPAGPSATDFTVEIKKRA